MSGVPTPTSVTFLGMSQTRTVPVAQQEQHITSHTPRATGSIPSPLKREG